MPASFQISLDHDREVPVSLGDGFLIDAHVRHDGLGPSTQPPGDRPGLDPPGLVPRDAQQPRRPFHRTLPKYINSQALEPGRELTPRLGQGHRDQFDPMGGTVHAGEVRLDPRRELAGVQMPPPSVFAIIARRWLLTLRAGIGPRASFDGHGNLCLLHIQFHVHGNPRGSKPQNSLIEFGIAHRSGPPFKGSSITQKESVTHTIS
jgi:hypothetical protein